jgi:hypothetical protein
MKSSSAVTPLEMRLSLGSTVSSQVVLMTMARGGVCSMEPMISLWMGSVV